jgi:hypothetical protein
MKLLNIIVVLALIAPAALAQPFDSLALVQGRQPSSTPGTRTLRGVVVTATDVPLARVRVAVFGKVPAPAGLVTNTPTGAVLQQLATLERLATQPPVLTDERGQFTVRVPDADSVILKFTKARYAALTVDVPRNVSNAQGATDLRVRLTLGGAISGQVRDQYGGPVMQVAVTARRLSPGSGADPLVLTATTNDLGEFRFGNLAAGAYAIAGRPPASVVPVSAALAQEEQTVNVSLGSEVGGIDLAVDVPSELGVRDAGTRPAAPGATGAVSGRITTARGVPIAGAVVQAYGAGDSFLPAVETDAGGRYVIDRIPPGTTGFSRSSVASSPQSRGRRKTPQKSCR